MYITKKPPTDLPNQMKNKKIIFDDDNDEIKRSH